MNDDPLLTIIVPTYNRSARLQLLLAELATQIQALDGRVQVIVGDNHSADDTPTVTRSFQARVPTARIIRHDLNLGADENFCRCLDVVTTKYFWIIGDDDLPKDGVIAKIIGLLEHEEPDLVYMGSEWVSSLRSAQQGTKVGTMEVATRSRLQFARMVHVWFTFISGVIVNRDTLQDALKGKTIRRFAGTNLVQLGWVFPVLGAGERFVEVCDKCMLATVDNTGGYAPLTVFGANFPSIARQAFGTGSALAELLISRTAALYLPQLIWAVRGSGRKRFSEENPWPAMRDHLGTQWSYWALLLPIGTFPKPIAKGIQVTWRLIVRIGNFGRRFARPHA